MKASRRKPKPTAKQIAALNLEQVQAKIAKLETEINLHKHHESLLLASLKTSKWDRFCKWFWDFIT